MRISDWSSDVCSSDLATALGIAVLTTLQIGVLGRQGDEIQPRLLEQTHHTECVGIVRRAEGAGVAGGRAAADAFDHHQGVEQLDEAAHHVRSEEHTSELQSLMRHSYAVFCLKN